MKITTLLSALMIFAVHMCGQDSLPVDSLERKDSLGLAHEINTFYMKYGLNPDSALSRELYAMVYEWKGTRYQHAGHSKKGVDCSGFACEIYKNCYDTLLPGGCTNMYTMVDTIPEDSLREGDLVFFKIKRGQISHVGIYLGKSYFAHASVHSGVTVSSLNEEYYKKYYFTGGRLRKSK